jgi:biopolymer transport protein ExbD
MAVKRRTEGVQDLNLTPIMNLVTILIPFLIMAAQFVNLAVIDSTLPAIGPPSTTPPDPNEEPPLNLSLAVTAKGITILGADAVLAPDGAPELEEGAERLPTVPCKSGNICTGVEDYDWDELRRQLGLIKDKYPDDENVILVPDNHMRYEVLVMTMDISREDPDSKGADGESRSLFPFVVISGGAM